MKKILILILAVLLACMTFTGCGVKNANDAAGTPDSASSPGAVSSDGDQAPDEGEKPEPVYGNQIKDGTYAIEVSSSSSMFRIVDAQLTVAGGEMSAVLTLSGDGYEKLYMGTGEEASADTDDKCIYFVEDAEGKYTYNVPVDALNQDTDCAAWSIRKQQWYDRVLVFQSSLIPDDAITME